MTGSVVNTLWARALVDELARAGLREVVIAPGSRSTPLVMAFAGDERIRTRVHLDERSAGFFALGVGKVTGRPAAVVTTSGTAVANLYPAVVEASQAGVPLLLLSADRPPRLRGADANQAIDQVAIFGRYPRAFHELPPPSADEGALRHLRVVASRAYAETVGADSGPVHVNLPFAKPLEPREPAEGTGTEEALGLGGRGQGAAFTRVRAGRPVLEDADLDALLTGIDPSRGVLVAGPSEDAERIGAAVIGLASAAGFPVLADPLSGARYRSPGRAHVVAGYDLFLGDAGVRRRLEPTVVLRVGAAPTSSAVQRWLEEHPRVEQVVVDAGGRWKDHGATAARYLRADPVDTLARAADRWSAVGDHATGLAQADLEWSDRWMRCEEATLRALDESREGPVHEGDVLAQVLDAVPDGGSLFVSSSMPIRDLDAFGHPRPSRASVFANRGASGIDGIVSTAFGVASQRSEPTVCVIGDVAFFHDGNGLLWSREGDARVVFVVVDNDGGGIFHRLPIAEHEPEFTRFFATPHGLDPRWSAQAHGVAYDEVDAAAIGRAVAEAVLAGRSAVLRVRTDRAENRRRHAEIEEAVARSVQEALE